MRILLLGPLEVQIAGRSLSLKSTMQRTLLAVLAIDADRQLSTDQIIDELWPECPPKTARKTLHGYVWRLRGALAQTGAEPVRDANGYRLPVDRSVIDVTSFETGVAAGQAALRKRKPATAKTHLAQALGLWRGPVLADVTASPSVTAFRAAVEETRLIALESWLTAELALGRHEQMIAELRSLVVQHGLHEAFHELLIRALLARGRRAEAAGVYRDLCLVLAEELGIAPNPVLQRLHREMSGDADTAGDPGRAGTNG